MELRDRLDALAPEDWARLDASLDELLDLDEPVRSERLQRIADERPEDAELLAHLLRSGADDASLDRHLRSTLSYLAEQDSPAPGTRIGPWRLVRPIGRGGMSEVFLAERADGAFQRRVALKLLWRGLVGEDGERFVRQERQILADLDDPRIAGLVDGGIHDDGRPWLAMDYIEGEHITDACRSRGVDVPTRLRWIAELAQAIASAHRQLIVHGDIKPANVLISEDGEVRLLDFGIGQLLQRADLPEDSVGTWAALTPATASPEQQAGRPLTPASDIFQLGLLMRAVLQDRPRPSGRRGREVDAILQCATAQDPRHRYQSADRMADDLCALLDHRPVAALRGGWFYRAACLMQRRWPALLLAFAVIAAGTGLLAHQLHQARLLAERNATTEAVLGYLEGMLNQSNPQREERPGVLREDLLDAAAAGLAEALGDQPRARTRVLLALGGIRQSRNEALKASRLHAEALELARANDWHEELDQALAGLAAAAIWSGDYVRSVDNLRELIELRLAQGAPPSEVGEARLQLADLLHSRGDYASALEQARLAYRASGATSRVHLVLGMILRDVGEFSQAQRHFDRALAIEHEQSPALEFRITEILDHYGVLLLHSGPLARAGDALDRSEQMRRAYLGEDWTGLFWSHHWQALHALASGEVDSAAERLDLVLADYDRHFGATSHLLAFGRSDRAWVALARDERQMAARLFGQAADRLETMQQGDHPRLAEVRLGQALLALAEGRREEARDAAAHAHRIRSELPVGEGSTVWQSNACRVLRWSGGRCTIDSLALAGEHLDTRRIQRALAGLCANASVPTIRSTALPCTPR